MSKSFQSLNVIIKCYNSRFNTEIIVMSIKCQKLKNCNLVYVFVQLCMYKQHISGELRNRLAKDDTVCTVNCSEIITILFYYWTLNFHKKLYYIYTVEWFTHILTVFSLLPHHHGDNHMSGRNMSVIPTQQNYIHKTKV